MTFPTRTVRTEPVAGSLVTLAEVKAQLSLFDDTTFDDYLQRLMIVATGHVGEVLGRSLDDTTIIDYYPGFDVRMVLSSRTVDGDVTITYQDSDHTTQTLASSSYILDTTGSRPSIVTTGSRPPVSNRFINPVQVEYTALDELLEDHEEVKQAILMMVADMFKHRENDTELSSNRVNITMDRLLRPHRSQLI